MSGGPLDCPFTVNVVIPKNVMIGFATGITIVAQILKWLRPFPSCLILGADVGGEHIHTVVSHDSDWIYLITAYRPDPDVWEPDFKTRKER